MADWLVEASRRGVCARCSLDYAAGQAVMLTEAGLEHPNCEEVRWAAAAALVRR